MSAARVSKATEAPDSLADDALYIAATAAAATNFLLLDK